MQFSEDVAIYPKVFVAIGNGVDLGLGMETGYHNFVKSPLFRALLGDNDEYVSEAINRCLDLKRERPNMQIYPNRIAQYIKEKDDIHNWVDLEVEIKNFCIEHKEELNSKDINRELYALRYFLYKYIQSNSSFAEYLDRNAFVPYHVLGWLVHQNIDFTLWNFNYTHSCERILSDFDFPQNRIAETVHYLHGSIMSSQENESVDIVLGTRYDSVVFSVCPSAIKSNISDNYYQKKNEMGNHLRDADVLLLYGCSVGESDQQYFESFLQNSKNLKTIININQSKNGLDAVLINLNLASDNQLMKDIEDGKIHYESFDTNIFNDNNLTGVEKKAKIDAVMKFCTAYE